MNDGKHVLTVKQFSGFCVPAYLSGKIFSYSFICQINNFLLSGLLFSILLFVSGFSQSADWVDEDTLTDLQLIQALKKYDEQYGCLLQELKNVTDQESLLAVARQFKPIFHSIGVLNAHLMAGILHLLERPSDLNNSHLNHTCKQHHVAALITRGQLRLSLYNSQCDINALKGAVSDLRKFTERYIYYRAITFNGTHPLNSITFPALTEFNEFMMDLIESQKIKMTPSKKLPTHLYMGFLRAPYQALLDNEAKKKSYLPCFMIANSPLDLLKVASLTPTVKMALGRLFPLASDDLERKDLSSTLALAAFRESLYHLSQSSFAHEITITDIQMAFIGSFFERQNIEAQEDLLQLCENGNFFHSLYNITLQSNDETSGMRAAETPSDVTGSEPFRLFKRAERELAELTKQQASPIFSPHEPACKLTFFAWFLEALQKRWAVFDFMREDSAHDANKATYQVLPENESSCLLRSGYHDQHGTCLQSNTIQQEDNYKNNPLIRQSPVPCLTSEGNVEAQHNRGYLSCFSSMCQYIANNKIKVALGSLLTLASVAGGAFVLYRATTHGSSDTHLNKINVTAPDSRLPVDHIRPTVGQWESTVEPATQFIIASNSTVKATTQATTQTTTQAATADIAETTAADIAETTTANIAEATTTASCIGFTKIAGKGLEPTEASCRPVPDYDPVRFLVLSDGFSAYYIRQAKKNDNIRKAKHEVENMKNLMAQHLPKNVTLVVYTVANRKPGSKDIRARYSPLLKGRKPQIIKLPHVPNDKLWARDGLPVPLYKAAGPGRVGLVNARYSKLKQDQRFADHFKATLSNFSRFFEGGNILADSYGNCFIVNNHQTKNHQDRSFQKDYCCNTLTRLPHQFGIGHVDEILFFINSNHVLTIEQYAHTLQCKGYTVTVMPKPRGEYASYLNAVTINDVVLVPVYNQTTDSQALEIYERFFSTVVPVQSTYTSEYFLGSAHCITRTYPDFH